MGYTHGRTWTNGEIKNDITKMVSVLKLDHFPTHSEMIRFFGNSALSRKVSRSGGTRYWAEQLHLPIKRCESEFGNDYELYAIKDIAKYTGLTAKQTKPRFPYDLLVDECVKIDVKASHLYQNNCHAYANTFNLKKKEPTCDFFIMYCLNLNEEISKTLIVPAVVLAGQTQVGVGKESKWDKYIDCWQYIVEFDAFINQYKNGIKNLQGIR